MAKPTRAGSQKKKLNPPSNESSSRGVSAVGSKAKPGQLDFQELERLLEVMGKHSVAEIEWASASVKLHVRKEGAFGGGGHFVPQAAHSIPAPVVSAPSAAAHAAPKAPPKANDRQKQILSPFVGTFYRSSSPQAAAYVQDGQTIKRGQVLCIIEAMKLMNEIESEFEGKLIEVLAENGQPVEFGEPLFLIET